MKRYITCVSVVLLVGMLISCGGGGGDDSSSGGSSAGTTTGGTPPTTNTGAPPPTNTGTPPPTNTGTPPPTNTGTPPPTNGGTPPPTTAATARFEESDAAAVTLIGTWTQSDSRWGWSGGTAVESTVPGSMVSFTFTGTSVRWIGSFSRDGGIAIVKVDGALVKVGGGPLGEVDLFARPREIRTPVLTLQGLAPGQHTLTIEVTGRTGEEAGSGSPAVVVVDAFEVEPQIVSHLQETDPDVAFSGVGWDQAPETSTWSGCCVRTLPDPSRGGAKLTETAGDKVTLKFRGTAISWVGFRGTTAGIASVQVDGGPATEVDLYAPSRKVQEIVFTKTGLADAPHTLTITATGRKNDLATAAQVVIDAFDVTTPGRRYQEWDPAVAYHGSWNRHNVARVWSEGATAASPQLNATATFSFTGTGVSWISCQKSSQGSADVYLDGVRVEQINNHRSTPIESYQHEVYRVDGLKNGPHTLQIVVTTNTQNYIVVDAFDVRGGP